jgi:4-amino-4-deoxy-L-arabinose transferase-like glycosyltransferase
MQTNKRYEILLQSIILIIAALFLFWNIGKTSVYEWDEARDGVNAWNMYHNGDYINNYYGNELDTWTAKPPLWIWVITASYHIFGFNEFALRFPSALAALLFFMVLFRLIRMFASANMAFLTCIILLGCRAIAAHHVGRTGDYDSLLLLFLICSLYCFCKYLYEDKLWGLYLMGILTGLAFYAKGTAGFLYLPGLFLLLIVSGQFKKVFTNKHTYVSFAIMIGIVLSWAGLVMKYGKTISNSYYGTKNSLEALFVHDTFKRLAVKDNLFHAKRDNFFFFHTIEVHMNMWHILFYAAVATGLFMLIKNRKRFTEIIRADENRFTLLCVCISLPIILVLNFAEQPWAWYFAPIWAFLAFITARWMMYAQSKWKPLYYVWMAVVVFNLVKHFRYIQQEPQAMQQVFSSNDPALNNGHIVILETPKENLMLYLTWLNKGFYLAQNDEELKQQKGRTAIIYTSAYDAEKFEKIREFDEYTLARVK